MSNKKSQISVRIPKFVYQSLQDYLAETELTQTQVVTYAIAKYERTSRDS